MSFIFFGLMMLFIPYSTVILTCNPYHWVLGIPIPIFYNKQKIDDATYGLNCNKKNEKVYKLIKRFIYIYPK